MMKSSFDKEKYNFDYSEIQEKIDDERNGIVHEIFSSLVFKPDKDGWIYSNDWPKIIKKY